MKKIIFILLLLSAFSVFGQYAPNGHFYFTGTISNNIPIQMELYIENYDTVWGSYYYENYGEIIILDKGTVDYLDVAVSECSDTGYTGIFTGTLSNSNEDFAETFTGTWTGADGKVFSFYLKRAAQFINLNLETSKSMVSGSFPFFTDNKNASLNESMDSDLANLIAFFYDSLDYIKSKELYFGWEAQNNISISFYSDDLISLESSYYEFTGGAHGNSFTTGLNYIYINGSWTEAGLNELFGYNSDYFNFLSDYVLQDLKEQGATVVTDSYYDIELSDDDLAYFTISPLGLTFIFSPYHMGSYAEGFYYVTVPFSVLKPYINRSSLLYRFF